MPAYPTQEEQHNTRQTEEILTNSTEDTQAHEKRTRGDKKHRADSTETRAPLLHLAE